jgi:exo-beta-1,3-glucanase (GH17 family)
MVRTNDLDYMYLSLICTFLSAGPVFATVVDSNCDQAAPLGDGDDSAASCAAADASRPAAASAGIELTEEARADGEEAQAMTTELLQHTLRRNRAVPADSSTSRSEMFAQRNTSAWNCLSASPKHHITASASKGVCLDDTTLSGCSGKIPQYWPNTKSEIKSVRIFKVWNLRSNWYPEEAFKDLKDYAVQNGVAYLLGLSVSCDSYADDQEWNAAMGFIRFIGPEYIMGLAVGNELDVNVGGQDKDPECVGNLWQGGRYFETLVKRVQDFDAIDERLSTLPITAVISARGLSDEVKILYGQSIERFGGRFVASFNIYPQFSEGLKEAGCQGSVTVGVKFATDAPAGFVPNVAKYFRTELNKNGWKSTKLWVTEVGWHTGGDCALKCDLACKNHEAQEDFYQNFLRWDMTAGTLDNSTEEVVVDHVFYFTLRDATAFGITEEFGIMQGCSNPHCKF